MPIYRYRETPGARKYGEEPIPTNPAMKMIPELVRLRDSSEQIEREMAYFRYVDARYGVGIDSAIHESGRRYQAFTGPISRQFKRGTMRPNPFTPLACLLAQSPDIDVGIAIGSYHAFSERIEQRRDVWSKFGIPAPSHHLSLSCGSLSEVLSGYPDSFFDEVTCRFPPGGDERMISGLILAKLNLFGSVNPHGASVLIGRKFPQGGALANAFDEAISRRLEGVEGYELVRGNHGVGGGGAPATLWQVVRKRA
jgi:hypothetical protein